MRYTFDSSVIIKGLLEPRRKKRDSLLKEQIRIHNIASSLMEKAYNKEAGLFIPTAAIIEVACVSSRLTGVRDIGIKTAEFVIAIATEILDEKEILRECIDMAATTRISGFDSVFITCAKVTDSTLITDDKKMFDAAVKVGVEAKLLRDIG